MENEVLIVGIFVSACLLSCVVIPGLLTMEDRSSTTSGQPAGTGCRGDVIPPPAFFTITISEAIPEVLYRIGHEHS